MESGNGNGTGTGTGYETRSRRLKIEDALMVLTIITCSRYWTFEINLHQYASFLCPFPLTGNGTYLTWRTFMKNCEKGHGRCYIDLRFSYIHLKDATIIQNIFLSVNPHEDESND